MDNENLDEYICKNVPSVQKFIGSYQGKKETLPALAVISHAMRLIQRFVKIFYLNNLSSLFFQLNLFNFFYSEGKNTCDSYASNNN